MKVAELEVLLTGDTTGVDKALKSVKDASEKIEKSPVKAKVDGDVDDALDGMGKVQAEAKKIVSAKTIAVIDADVERGTAKVDRIKQQIEELQARALGGLDVDADIKKAEANLSKAQRSLDGLVSARAKIEVEADTSKAEKDLDGLADKAGAAGSEAGDAAGGGLMDGIVGALDSTPIVGAIVGIGALAAAGLLEALNDGLQVEVRQDRLQSLTGITEAQANRFGRDASEAYSQGFGESIESNMDTARLAIQSGLLDPAATRKDAQNVIASLSGIADVLEEDVKPTSQAVTTMLRTGLVKSADEAFDVLAAGAKNGVNASEDLLDTFIEYPALFKRLGLDGPTALGLVSQGLKAGARNSDLAADALKEFQIRATDGSKLSAEGFAAIGLSASEMTAKIAAGGDGAREGLDQVLDGLRNMEDPVARNAAAVALFGTQAEDLGEALFAMDPSTAVEALGQVTGAAKTMFDTLANNDASKMETARRNIEVAADGIKGALAAALSDPIGEFGEWVASNRGPLMEFLAGLINGALDFGGAVVEGMASGTEAIGRFVSGPLADIIEGIGNAIESQSWLNAAMGVLGPDLPDPQVFLDMADGMRDFEGTTKEAADSMRTELGGALDTARTKFNEFADPIINDAYLNDATLRLAKSIDTVGVAAADGTPLLLDMNVAQDGLATSGSELEQQLVKSAGALNDELTAAAAAGEGQDELSARYNTTRDALIAQVSQMGLGTEASARLVDQILKTPETASTAYSSNSAEEKQRANELADRILTLPDGSIQILAADNVTGEVNRIIRDNNGKTIRVNVTTGQTTASFVNGRTAELHDGAALMPMARGGTLTPMAPIAQVVDPNTWRVIGDRMKGREWFIPEDGSDRSLMIAQDMIRNWPGGFPGIVGMQDGGVNVASRVDNGSPGVAFTRFAPGEMDQLAAIVTSAAARIADATLSAQHRSDLGTRSTAGVLR